MKKPGGLHAGASQWYSKRMVGALFRLIKRVFILGLVILGLVWVASFFWAHTPDHTLVQAGVAVFENDRLSFERHVDIDALTYNMADQIIALRSAQQPEAKNLLDSLGQQVSQGLASLSRPVIAYKLKTELRRFVETNTLAPQFQENERIPLRGMAMRFFGELGVPLNRVLRKRLPFSLEPVGEGTDTLVRYRIYYKQQPPLVATLEKKGNKSWRVIAVDITPLLESGQCAFCDQLPFIGK